jgi:hypothetical protein
MKGMGSYYGSRAVISAALGIVLVIGGIPLWAGIAGAVVVFALFLWAPRSGRYAVSADGGPAALRRDERGQAISDKAARTAFAFLMLGLMAVTLYFGSGGRSDAPTSLLALLLGLGMLVYFASDFWQRRGT